MSYYRAAPRAGIRVCRARFVLIVLLFETDAADVQSLAFDQCVALGLCEKKSNGLFSLVEKSKLVEPRLHSPSSPPILPV